jgi:hypothetical protein
MNYSNQQPYSRITYTVNNRVVIDQLLDDLHTIQLDYIDEAVDKSDLSDAKAVIQWIKEKL